MTNEWPRLSLWERGRGSTNAALQDGALARFYGIAKVYKSGSVYDEVWRRLVRPEKERDPAEDLGGKPLAG